MHGSAKWILSGVGLALLFCTGCRMYPYSPYYNGYYGSGGYGPGYGPTYAPQPGGFVDPGGTYVPQNFGPTLAPGSPTPLNSGTPPTSTTPNWRTPSGNTGGDAPLFNNNPVPTPQPDFGAPPAAVLPRPQPLSRVVTPFPQTVVANIQPTGLQTVDPFVGPAPISIDGDAQPMPLGGSPPVEPYAFDGADFKWLKGIVDFDDETKSWSVIYALVPQPTDKFGGHFVLGPSDELKSLQKGDLVLIAGEPHPTLKDRGRPVYHVSKVTVLGRPSATR